mmetsp:Transcript_119782/g.255602  ORF Transcript_119782/g.255602 Transcript_119782/m.255602 type:complete len:156 (-) Transcript_119782:7-474(-)
MAERGEAQVLAAVQAMAAAQAAAQVRIEVALSELKAAQQKASVMVGNIHQEMSWLSKCLDKEAPGTRGFGAGKRGPPVRWRRPWEGKGGPLPLSSVKPFVVEVEPLLQDEEEAVGRALETVSESRDERSDERSGDATATHQPRKKPKPLLMEDDE